jgi:hypothetical protein
MRKVLLIALMLVLLVGCRKGRRASTGSPAPPSDPNAGMAVHAPTGVVINSGSGGGSGGAAQAVRKAVLRTVTRNELRNIHQFMESASSASTSGQLPTPEEVLQVLQREDRKAFELVKEGAIVLTGTRSRENIWAYAKEPQVYGGEHLVVISSGITSIPGPALAQRLQQERGQ